MTRKAIILSKVIYVISFAALLGCGNGVDQKSPEQSSPVRDINDSLCIKQLHDTIMKLNVDTLFGIIKKDDHYEADYIISTESPQTYIEKLSETDLTWQLIYTLKLKERLTIDERLEIQKNFIDTIYTYYSPIFNGTDSIHEIEVSPGSWQTIDFYNFNRKPIDIYDKPFGKVVGKFTKTTKLLEADIECLAENTDDERLEFVHAKIPGNNTGFWVKKTHTWTGHDYLDSIGAFNRHGYTYYLKKAYGK